MLYDKGRWRGTAPLVVVGVFEPKDPLGWWWRGQQGDAAYTTLDTIAATGVTAYATYDLLLPPA